MSVPPSKRAKLEMTPLSASPRLTSLIKFHSDSTREDPSPGSLQGCRVALRVPAGEDSFVQTFTADGRSLYSWELRMAEGDDHVTGLDGISVPTPRPTPAPQLLAQHALPFEIQSITLHQSDSGALLGAIDCCGQAQLQPIDERGHFYGPALRLPSAEHLMEPGWAGMVVDGDLGGSRAVTACQFGKCITWYAGDKIVRHSGTLHQPLAISQLPSRPDTIAVAESHQVTIWDSRSCEGTGCVQRLNAHAGNLPLYALAADSTGNMLGCGGEESCAFIFDVRKFGQPFDRWASCLKHDILWMHFPSRSSDHVIVGGADQEVRCSLVSSKARKELSRGPLKEGHSKTRSAASVGCFSFRSDSRWLGVTRAADTDMLAGYSASQSIFLATAAFGI